MGGPRRGCGPGCIVNGGRMAGSVHRGPLSNARPSSYSIAKSIRRPRVFPWQHDLFEDSLRAAGISGIEVVTKLYVSNLHPGVTNDDIRVQLEIDILILNTVYKISEDLLIDLVCNLGTFAEIGELKRYAIHYDKTGHPSGSAEVVYTRRSNAFAALRRYNNVLLDGKPMKIEIVGANSEVPVSACVNVTGVNGRRKRTVVMTSGPGHAGGSVAVNRGSGNRSRRGGMRNSQGRGRGRGRGQGQFRGRDRIQGKKKPVDKSADDLDKELDKYHAEAMQT